MKTAIQVDEYITRGDSQNLAMQILNEDNTPYNLIGCKVELKLYHSLTDASPAVKLDGTLISITEGEVGFSFTEETTKNLPAKAYDLEVIVIRGTKKWTAYQGRFGILPSGGAGNA